LPPNDKPIQNPGNTQGGHDEPCHRDQGDRSNRAGISV